MFSDLSTVSIEAYNREILQCKKVCCFWKRLHTNSCSDFVSSILPGFWSYIANGRGFDGKCTVLRIGLLEHNANSAYPYRSQFVFPRWSSSLQWCKCFGNFNHRSNLILVYVAFTAWHWNALLFIVFNCGHLLPIQMGRKQSWWSTHFLCRSSCKPFLFDICGSSILFQSIYTISQIIFLLDLSLYMLPENLLVMRIKVEEGRSVETSSSCEKQQTRESSEYRINPSYFPMASSNVTSPTRSESSA